VPTTAASPTAQPTSPPNLAAQVNIFAPAGGSAFTDREPITFLGTANDPEDGNLDANLTWSSNLGGVLGRGPSFTVVLPAGVHRIMASVTDVDGQSVNREMEITVIPANLNAPIVQITSPSPDATFREAELITFTASAQDLEDGDLSAGIFWIGTSGQQLGSGALLQVSAAVLGAGSHMLTATANDAGGRSGVDSISITVLPDQPPTITILSPKEGETFEGGFPILFAGQASDAEDGDIAASIVWTSDSDGELFRGETFEKELSPGNHIVTAAVTDSHGATQQSSVTITVTGPPDLVASIVQTGPAAETTAGRPDGALLRAAAQVDYFEVPVQIVVENQGWRDAGPFYVTIAFRYGDDSSPVPLAIPGSQSGYAMSNAPLSPGQAIAFDGEVWLPIGRVPFGATVELSATADSCLPDRTLSDPPCMVEESNEANNNSPAVFVTMPESNFAPDVKIVYPDAATSYSGDYDDSLQAYYSVLDLVAEASDFEDGPLSDSAYVWTTDRADLQSSELGTGKVISAQLLSLDACNGDEHLITVTVADSDGNVSTQSVSVTIYGTCIG
jgi:hypothetical protein